MAGFIDMCAGCGAAVPKAGLCAVCESLPDACKPSAETQAPPEFQPAPEQNFVQESSPVSQEAWDKLGPRDFAGVKHSDLIEGSFDIKQPCKECGTIILPSKRVDVEEFKDLCYTCYSKKPKHIYVDFDGVLAEYDGWKGPEYLGQPRTFAKEFLKELKAMGYTVVIFTTRRVGAIQGWLRQYDMWHLVSKVTNEKGPALCYVDDRNVVFRGSFSDAITDIKGFLPYWRTPRP